MSLPLSFVVSEQVSPFLESVGWSSGISLKSPKGVHQLCERHRVRDAQETSWKLWLTREDVSRMA